MVLYDGRGREVSSKNFKKAPGPRTGSPFTKIYGPDADRVIQVPSSATIQFNLDNLTVKDYRTMISHYQVNSSLAVLSHMLHQSDWHIECEGEDKNSSIGKKVAQECEEQLRAVWTPLNRGMSAANWAGYSPMLLEWENNLQKGRVILDKIKDLIPEACEPNWKEIDAWIPERRTLDGQKINRVTPKVKIYDGIKQVGSPEPIPVENTLWYPLLMENGNYWGRKLLKAAFQPWYFSILIHLFANRYYERFGEPIVVGRAPFDDSITLPGTTNRISGVEYMLSVMKDLRSKSAVSLPNERTEMSSGRFEFDYNLDYLESQMRGADFERYLTRLDEEISIGLFTPILLLRTADVGSYNLGVGHMQMYLWMLNAMNDDRALYIDKYILRKIADYNFGVNSPTPRIKFRKLGNQNSDVVKIVVQSLLDKGAMKFDIREVGEIIGMTADEIAGMQTKPPEPTNPGNDPADDGGDPETGTGQDPASGKPRGTAKEITARVQKQAQKLFSRPGGVKDSDKIDLGYFTRMQRSFAYVGVKEPVTKTKEFFDSVNSWVDEAKLHAESSEEFMSQFERVVDYELAELNV